MGFTALFCIIHGSYCTISTNIYLYLQDFQKKISISVQLNKRISNRPKSLLSFYFLGLPLSLINQLILFHIFNKDI